MKWINVIVGKAMKSCDLLIFLYLVYNTIGFENLNIVSIMIVYGVLIFIQSYIEVLEERKEKWKKKNLKGWNKS